MRLKAVFELFVIGCLGTSILSMLLAAIFVKETQVHNNFACCGCAFALSAMIIGIIAGNIRTRR